MDSTDASEYVDKKNIAKTKSHDNALITNVKNEAAKRKSLNLNNAVKSLDLALGRLKKSKLVKEDNRGASRGVERRAGLPPDIAMHASCHSSNINPGIDSASVMSMNFSHYELMRNLSRTNSTSEGTFSGATDGQTDMSLKHEHLEKYFRSSELWAQEYDCSCHTNSVHFELTDQ